MNTKNIMKNLGRNAGLLVAQGLKLLPIEVPEKVFLELKGGYPVFAPKSPLPIPVPLPGQRKIETLSELSTQLEALIKLPSVRELIVLERGFSGGFAESYAIRGLFERVRAVGKTVTFYGDGLNNLTMYIASACNNVVTLSEGQIVTIGLAAQVMFQANTLKKIGVEVEVERRAEFKNAANTLTETHFTEAHRESLESLIGNVYEHWLEMIASGRSLEKSVLQDAVDASPLLAHEALERGLISKIAFEDELTLNAKPLLEMLRFAPTPPLDWGGAGTVALIGIEGTIADGESKNNPLPLPLIGGRSAGGYSVSKAIRSAAQDQNIKAIVLYVDSPGGSALASELIWREVTRAKTVKPVIAVMGNLAASGGYYVSCNATRIIAAPSTITGSIGVINAHLNTAELWDKLGFTMDIIKFAQHADYGSGARALTPSERDNMSRSVQHIYNTFKTRVADGRGLSSSEVEAVAKGRVWTGSQGLERGLVDEIGTVFDGLRIAKQMAGLPDTARVMLMTPPPKFVAPTDFKALASALETRFWTVLPEQIDIR